MPGASLVLPYAQQFGATAAAGIFWAMCTGCSGYIRSWQTKCRASAAAVASDLEVGLPAGLSCGEGDLWTAGPALVEHRQLGGSSGRESRPHCETQWPLSDGARFHAWPSRLEVPRPMPSGCEGVEQVQLTVSGRAPPPGAGPVLGRVEERASK
jgi:hypothetical protein